MILRNPNHFMAASVPRFIRTARLPWLRHESIIGCWTIENAADINYIYDVIMLPAEVFAHMRAALIVPYDTSPALRRSSFVGTYIPKDIKEVKVPHGKNAAAEATRYFIEAFSLNTNRTVYADGTKVTASIARRTLQTTASSSHAIVKSAKPARRRALRSPTGLLRTMPVLLPLSETAH